MGKDERYDFVVVGGGPNGIALSAYLGKCGASVCVLEERPEAGGACENTEPIPGVRITPHAMYMYAGAAPGFDGLLRAAWRERGFGDFWGYALVAEGAAEAMLEAGLKPWDIAAPMLVIEEAGGKVTDFAGVRSIHAETFLATNGILHRDVLDRLRSAG